MFIKKIMLAILAIAAFATTSMAQKNASYDTEWKKVDAFEKKGLTKSALETVVSIYNLAVKDNNDAQQIKSSMYQIKYHNMVDEDSRENNIFFVDTLIEKAKTPAKNILQSMQAEMFWQYLQNNRYKFYDRTKLVDEKSKDITTWSLDKLYSAITKLYKASINNESILKATGLDDFTPVIVKGENTRQLRPTLYDFLAHRALSYFMTDETDLTKPAYQFKINDPKAFAPSYEFASASFKTKDSASLHHTALLILQDILKFHSADAKPDALIDADLIRLNFVNQYSVGEGKEKLYEAALKDIETRYADNPLSAQAGYLRAQIYYNRGQAYDALSKGDNQYEIKRAKELAETIAAKFPKSEGGINAQNLISQIQQPTLNLETEKVNVINQPFRTLVTYKNIQRLYLRLVKTSKEEIKNLDRREYEKYWSAITALKPSKSWSIDLPDPKDFQTHSTEIKIDAMQSGIYCIVASIDPNFSTSKNLLAKQLTYVSNISFINDHNNYYVLNRDNGQPLANTAVQVWESNYNYTTSKTEEVKAEAYTTDKNGYFKLKSPKQYRNFTLQFKTANDELFLDEGGYSNDYVSAEPVPHNRTFLFSDRSIYRPGQLLYFKGIVLQTDTKNNTNKIQTNFNTRLWLRDANGQKVDSIKLTTNDFGSYKGSFKLPEGLLNGQFTLYDDMTQSTQYFSVEEYKRPQFFVEVQKPKGTYKLNDSIKVTGTAKAYAGNNVDGASVKYRVVRKVQYPIWWSWGYFGRRGGRYPSNSNDQVEIMNGTTTTNAKGEFYVTFKAQPDESVDKSSQPTFTYEVSADITDLNGETRSGNTMVAVAYQMIQLNINVADKIIADSLKNLAISSTNLNNIFEKAKVNVTINKVLSPDKIFRSRYWTQADQFVMSKEEYYNNFPYDIYKDEDKTSAWAIGEKLLDKTDSTKENSTFDVSNSKFSPGWYKIIAITKDKNGEEVRAEKFVQLIDDSPQTIDRTTTISVSGVQNQYQPNDKISYNIKTGFENLWLIQTITKMDKTTTVTYPVVKATQPYNNSINVNEADRGGIGMNYAFIQHNRVYNGSQDFYVPWKNKDLNITYSTFRDKVLPGSEEKWKVKITGNKSENAAAELLASMYDASLDQFKPQSWSKLSIWPSLYNSIYWTNQGFAAVNSEEYNKREINYISGLIKSYDALLGGYYSSYYYFGGRREMMYDKAMPAPVMSAAAGVVKKSLRPDGNAEAFGTLKDRTPLDSEGWMSISDSILFNMKTSTDLKVEQSNNNEAVQIRKNFNETAFFYPDLVTDAEGNVEFSFTIPEALTTWKLMTFAHTKDLASGYSENKTITQKSLMVQPNAPRFLREGDRMEFSTKIVNLGDSEVTGTAQLELLDAATNKPVDGWFKNVFPVQYFTIAKGQSGAVKFPIDIPFNFNSALTYRIVAKTGNASDGEEMALPVLTNRMLVTESLPLNVRNTTSKTFKFDKLINSAGSTTISNHALTVEYTSNPAWYAVQALPYLMEYPYECAEQTFNRYYANALATNISTSTPKIKAIFEQWKTVDTAALQSNLAKNQELKQALLEETPWVLAAQNEAQQKKNIALLFDMVKMSGEMKKAFAKLKEAQSSNGGFVWFKGGADDRYMTQYILTGIGHLKKLNALSGDNHQNIKTVVDKAIPYLDKKIKEDYDNLIKYKVKLSDNNLSYYAIQYLYMRTFFSEYKIADASSTAYNYYRDQAQKYWLSQSKYMQAMVALALYRTQDEKTPKDIIRSLKENSINKEEMGMYWKEWTTGGYYWHQAPIESQAMMIEAFTDIDKNVATIDDLKTWLLKQKQTQNWKTTKATAEACYALLLGGSNWLAEEKEVTINLGSTAIKSTDVKTEAGTGYFKTVIPGEKVKPEMGNISVNITKSSNQSTTSWGSIYWQYFEDLDKIIPIATGTETPLKLTKKLYIERNSDKGPVLESLADGAQLKVGDKIKVRIELKVDRDMEYVHMKDMRAACMEPTNVLSGYQYQGSLGYYQSTKDASTNFFFGWLARGSYVFEYPMFVTLAGNFSNGITTIQCMYAPEFTSHSEGIRVNAE